MNMTDIVSSLRATYPELFSGMSDAKIRQLVRAIAETVKEGVDTLEVGIISVTYLGRFRAGLLQSVDDNKKPIKTRCVTFVSAKN